METFLLILKYISGPLVGAVIGYFTNYLAVKMLFRPYYPKKIGKRRIPFTPGIIPKRQPQLAKAIGHAVGEELFTGDDIKTALSSEETKNKVADTVVDALLSQRDGQPQTAETLALAFADREKVEGLKESVSETVCKRLLQAADEIDLGDMIAEQGAAVVKEKKASLGMLAFVVSDNMINGLMAQLSDKINAYIRENGAEKLLPAVKGQVDELAGTPINGLIDGEKRTELKKFVGEAYGKLVENAGDVLLKELDIAGIVESKVNAMDVKELEKLCLSVMKKELNAVVNLGAVIGFIIGILNIFI